jgi:hypothetical protein
MNKSLLAVIAIVAIVGGLIGGFIARPSAVSKLGGEGDTNLINLVLSGTLSAVGITNTGAFTQSATSTMSGTGYVGSLIQGNGTTTITASATTSVTAAQICNAAGYIEWAPTVVNASFTLPVATSLVATCLPTNGMFKKIRLVNTSGTDTGFVVSTSTGTSVWSASSSANFLVNSSTPAFVTFDVINSTTVQVLLEKFTVKE